MKGRLPLLLLAMITAFATSVPAAPHGSSAAGLVAIPFQFIVGDKLLPPGTYQLWSESSDWETMRISSAGSTEILARARTVATVRRAPNDGRVHVRFENYYGQYFLVWVGLPLSDGHEVKMTRERAARILIRLNLMPAEPADVSKR